MTSFALKLIAVIAMITDHTAVAFRLDLPDGVQLAMRSTGRIAMPIFCFLIAEGLFHTKSVKKYAGRLLIFAVLSEVPFDLLVHGRLWNTNTQNVFFTLFLGLLGILCFDICLARGQQFLALFSIVMAGALALLLQTDYGPFGVFFIFAFYAFRGNKSAMFFMFSLGVMTLTLVEAMAYKSLSIYSLISMFELAALIPIWLYNGKKGLGNRIVKYGFYVFYPAHLLVLFALQSLLSFR